MRTHHPKILLVDDDRNISQAFEEFLKKDHCEMISAMNYDLALFYLREEEHVGLVISEMRLGEHTGIPFLKKLRASRPDLPVIVMTGYPDQITQEDIVMLNIDYVFTKPVDIGALRRAAQKYVHVNA